MADDDPPVIPKTSSGLPIAIGIAVLAGGAVAYWLARPKVYQAPAAALSAQPAPTTPARVVKDAPPPPPPPLDAPARAAAPSTAAGAQSVAAAPATPAADPGPCGGSCKGQDTPELQSALRARAGQARSCYERALSANTGLTGKLTVSARIGPDGSATCASVAEDTLGDPGVSRCVLSRFQSGTYPKPQSGCVDVAVPINFVPRQ
jgi:outer membrane biosynthesis protein TonB